MSDLKPLRAKAQRAGGRPPFEQIALLLQGGGALGAYQAGAYEALAEAGLHADWVAGISIGAVNAALIAGNPPELRVERLRAFWEAVTARPFHLPGLDGLDLEGDLAHRLVNQTKVFGVLVHGTPSFFTPRLPPPYLRPPGSIEALSFYDVTPLRSTLERLVDFDRIKAGPTRLSVGAVNVRTGNFVYFDTTTHRIAPEHVLASGSLPPGFPPTEIDGELYWDGGIVSNTPLQWVLESRPRRDTLAFQVDLWSARGPLPRDLTEVELRQKEIRFSSRTRAMTDQIRLTQKLRRAVRHLIDRLPAEERKTPEIEALAQQACGKVFTIVHLIYHAKKYEGSSMDYEFSRRTMEEHWRAGYADVTRTLRHREALQPPEDPSGVRTFDVARLGHSQR